MIASLFPALRAVDLRLRTTVRWLSKSPCEKLRRAMFMPARIIFSMTSDDSEAGPIVHTIFVLLRGSIILYCLLFSYVHLSIAGCPVEARMLLQSHPSGSIFLRCETASGVGTWVNWWFQKPTIMPVLPAMPACTALCPSSRQNRHDRRFLEPPVYPRADSACCLAAQEDRP